MEKRKHAIFITGFNNWGKTTIIGDLFNRRAFARRNRYLTLQINGLNGIEFTVQTRSNDDITNTERWREDYIMPCINSGGINVNLITAFCPTFVENAGNLANPNDFVHILSNAPFTSYQYLHVFLIKYKWDLHAKLICDNIENAGRGIPHINFIRINEQNSELKQRQMLRELNSIFTPS